MENVAGTTKTAEEIKAIAIERIEIMLKVAIKESNRCKSLRDTFKEAGEMGQMSYWNGRYGSAEAQRKMASDTLVYFRSL